MERVRLPADVELEDRLAFGLTARQLLLLFATALAAYGDYSFAASLMPLPLAAAARAHLRFLTELGAREGVRRREILLVLSIRARDKQNAQRELTRRAGEAQELLRPA